MIKIFLLFSLVLLWALQFMKPRITRVHKKDFLIEQVGMTLLFAVLVLIVILGV